VCTSTGERVILATDDGVVRQWGLGADHTGEVRSIAAPAPFFGVWTPAGDALLTTHFGGALMPGVDGPPTGSLHRYDAASGALVAQVGDLHPFPPWWLAVSPDGRFVATNANPFGDVDPAAAGVDVPRWARLRVHNAVTLEPVLEVEGGGWPLAFSDDSALLLAGGSGLARIVETGTGRLRREVVVATGEGESEIGAGAFLPGGRHAALVGHLTRLGWIVDVDAGAVAATFCRAGGTAKAALSPDARRLAVAAGPASTEVGDVATLLRSGGADCDSNDRAGLVRTLEGDAAMGITFAPGGRLLAAAGFDGVVTVWDVDSGEQELRIVHDGQVGGASFSPDGRHLLVTVNDAGGSLHAVRIYTLDADELVAIARRRVTRDLQPHECETFLSSPCLAR
jgi:dipeptidyl aminopeptidase/acylaminoacyl peptidase